MSPLYQASYSHKTECIIISLKHAVQIIMVYWSQAEVPHGTYVDLVEPEDSLLVTTSFADDIILYRTIQSFLDYLALQDDISSIATWVTENYLSLNADKGCYIMLALLKKKATLLSSFTTTR